MAGFNRAAFLQQAKAEVKAFLWDSKLNIMLAALPFAFVSRFAGWADGATFTLSCVALVPLAERLGFVTEQLAMYTNDTLGGLLNATFGNATEMIISGFALAQARAGGGETYLRVVQLSLLGSVISNLLLVMGTAFIAGGIKTKTQTFNQTGINVNSGMLVLGTFAIMLPSLLDATHSEAHDNKSELALSRFESICMFLCYCMFLYFQLKTHKHLYEEAEDDEESGSGRGGASAPNGAASTPAIAAAAAALPPSRTSATGAVVASGAATPPLGAGGASDLDAETTGALVSGRLSSRHLGVELVDRQRTSSGRSVGKGGAAGDRENERLPLVLAAERPGGLDAPSDDEANPLHHLFPREEDSKAGSDEDEELLLSKPGCFIWLTIVTIFVAFLSEFVTDAIKGASHSLRIPLPFLTTILLPIVGNAAEHASAIIFAYRNRVEIALGVAVGSSTQVAMMVVPFTVLLAWMMGQPLDLDFNSFESFVLFGSVLLAVLVLQDGKANYLKGVLLLLTYFFISAGFWCHKDRYLEDVPADAA